MRKFYLLCMTLFLSYLLQAQTVYQIGSGTSSNLETDMPAPFQDYYNNSRQQILIRASELTAAGMGAGNITKIGFNVTALNELATDVSEQYKIFMKNTSTTALTTTFETGTTQVYGPVDLAISATGVFEITLSTPFAWDGSSNLLIEICQGQTAADLYSENASTTYSSTAFNSYLYYRSDVNAACTRTTGTTSTSRPNVYITATTASGCTGTPNPGNTVSSSGTTACANTTFILSTQNAISGSGLTYQWMSSSDGTNYSDITGATSSTYSATQTVPTYYKVSVSCSGGGSAISNPLFLGVTPPTQCYCPPQYATGCTDNDRITNFVFNTISNNSGTACQATAPLGYTVYPSSSFTTTLTQGSSYPANITTGSGGSSIIAIWIDYNDNGVFESSEKYETPNTVSASSTATIPVSVPVTAPTGQHRMRVRLVYSTSVISLDPCNSYTYGEAEDYTISIVAATPCGGLPNGGTTTVTPAVLCGTGKAYLNNTGAGPGSGLSFQWQSSSDSTSWSNLPGITGLPDSATISSTTYFRLAITCANGGQTGYSAGVKVIVTSVPVNDDCSNAITINMAPSAANCTGAIAANTTCATQSPNTSIGWSTSLDDDIWYRFVATNSSVTVKVSNFIVTKGTATALAYVIYNDSTDCSKANSGHELTTASPTVAITNGSGQSTFTGLTVGNTYTLRLFASGSANGAMFNFCLQEPPAPPASCATNTFPANGAIGVATPVTFSWTPVTGATSYTFFLGINNPPTASDSITTVTTNSVSIIGGLPNTTYYWYVIPKNAGGAASGCVANTTSFTTANPPANDQCSNAIALTVNNGFCSTPVLGTLAFADSTTGLGTASCQSSALKYDVWYTVTVQPGKKVVVQTSAINTTVTDLIMQAYTGVCGSLTSKACDDDSNPEVAPSANHPRLSLTNTGSVDSVYYIRVMPYSTNANMGAFAICAWDTAAPALRTVAPGTLNSCVTGTSVTVDSLNANLYMWVPLYDGSGNIIGEVYPNGNVLGNVSSGLYKNGGALRSYNGQYYLDRNITITTANQPNPANKVKVRLYFTNSELTAFQTALPSATRSNLVATKVNTGCTPAYSPVQPVLERAAANSGYRTDDHYIQLDTISSFSSFFIHLSGTLAPLPANLLTFAGQRAGSVNQLKWTVAQEQDVQAYEVERSDDGRTWSKAGSVASLGNTSSQRSYGFADNNISGSKQFYRLRQLDRNGAEKLSNIIVITGSKPTVLTLSGLFPNPAITRLNVLVDAPAKDNITITVMDAVGRVVKAQKVSVEAGSNNLPLDVSGLSQGSYLLKLSCQSNCESVTGKFIKE